MHKFRKIKDRIYYSCQDPECPSKNTPHYVSKEDIAASLYTLLEDLADDNDDPRLEAAEVGIRYLLNILYPVTDKKEEEEMPFEQAYLRLRRELNAMTAFAMFQPRMKIDPKTAS